MKVTFLGIWAASMDDANVLLVVALAAAGGREVATSAPCAAAMARAHSRAKRKRCMIGPLRRFVVGFSQQNDGVEVLLRVPFIQWVELVSPKCKSERRRWGGIPLTIWAKVLTRRRADKRHSERYSKKTA